MSGLGRLLACAGGAVLASAAHAQGPTLDNRVAVLQGLDKVTARVSTIRAPLNQPTHFGTLEVVARACRETPPTEPPESAAFLEIRELPPASEVGGTPADLFSGWMFSSSPGLSTLEHPVYDVWVVDCRPASAEDAAGKAAGSSTE